MEVVVRKYGGSSLATVQRIREVARRIGEARSPGEGMVVVVSAMGHTTDDLLALARQISPRPDPRELDLLLSTGETVSATLLAMALMERGDAAISLTGAQAGIQTEALHGQARIQAVDVQRIRHELSRGAIVVVTGFQGITAEMDVTTLGRGASDTTAVALAAALGARVCTIYTDVAGVYTADPHVVAEARPLQDLSYEEMMELSTAGAQVLHARSVELAALFNVQLHVHSSFEESPGTLVHSEVTMENVNRVRGIAQDANVAKITLQGIPDRPGIAAALFESLAQAGISVDTIVQNASVERLADLTFTVTRDHLAHSLEVVNPIARSLGAREIVSDGRLAKVSIVGMGMQSAPGYAARMFRALAEAAINIEMITTSEIRITCIVAADRLEEAVRVLHRAFALEAAE